jgi:hypothetical protein
MVIKVMIRKTYPLDSRLAIIIARAKKEASIQFKISFYHVLHALNLEVDYV